MPHYLIDTPRLTLRPVQPADVGTLHRHWTHPAVRHYLWDDVVISADDIQAIVRTSIALFEQHGFGLWALRLNSDAALIGCGGYWYFRDPPELELVLSLDEAHWGRGLAAEACRALLTYGFDGLGMDVVQASTDPPNAASVRLMERLGMQKQRRETVQGLDTVFYSLSRQAWMTGPND